MNDPATVTNWPQALVMIMPGVLTFLTSSVTLIIAYLTRRQLGNVHLDLNSRLDAYVKAERSAGRAEGVIAGAAAERADQRDRPDATGKATTD